MVEEAEKPEVIATPEAKAEVPLKGDAPDKSEPRKPLRDQIRDTIKTVNEKTVATQSLVKEDIETPDAPKTGRERNDAGKFSPKEIADKEALKPADKPAITAPADLPADIKSEWAKLPSSVQSALIKREEDVHKKLTTMDEERGFAREMNKTFLPYMPLINAVGSTPAKAVSEMLNYAQILQYGSPASKAQLLWQLAQRHGADMRITPQTAQQPQYQLQNVQQELQQTKEQLAKLPELIKQQQEDEKLQSVISAFASDPNNAHYERVKPVMAALLSGGQASDMKDAYERACFSDPEIRSGLLAEKQKEAEAKRIAEIKAKADKARSASVSVKGSSGLSGAGDPVMPKRSLREDLRANLRAATSH